VMVVVKGAIDGDVSLYPALSSVTGVSVWGIANSDNLRLTLLPVITSD